MNCIVITFMKIIKLVKKLDLLEQKLMQENVKLKNDVENGRISQAEYMNWLEKQ